ncbi:LppU/SCO3897 family protein [Nocardia mangyaensis]|uniref:LppU/SCO3897 family protein n=1 Tax=Nocardia mangyaensis TaxID=2213200 RepID=UPI0012EB84F7|nr:hypothetical protein [Nocardia mangyaensis]
MESALMGWYGFVSVLVTPVILVQNIGAAKRIKQLSAPIPGSPRAPLDPGKPLVRRPGMLGLLIPVVIGPLLVWAFVAIEARSANSAEVGDCVVNLTGKTEDDRPKVEKVSCSDPAAMGKVVARVGGSRQFPSPAEDFLCSGHPTTEFVYTTDDFTLCLEPPR